MRTTKVYSITMPPDLARQAEALAKKENRTMSELMREALRRYQQPQPATLDMREYIRQLAPTPPAYQAIREDARRKGTDKLTAEYEAVLLRPRLKLDPPALPDPWRSFATLAAWSNQFAA
jgi:hypothetical protein